MDVDPCCHLGDMIKVIGDGLEFLTNCLTQLEQGKRSAIPLIGLSSGYDGLDDIPICSTLCATFPQGLVLRL